MHVLGEGEIVVPFCVRFALTVFCSREGEASTVLLASAFVFGVEAFYALRR